MDTIKTNNVPQRREEDWHQLLLYEELRRGPKIEDKWTKTLDKLHLCLLDENNRRRLIRQLLIGETDKDWTKDRLSEYLDDASAACTKISDYTTTDSWN
jgi:hypothetical protein